MVLGGTRASHKASNEPNCQGWAEDDQRPPKSGHPDHRNLIAEPAKRSAGLEKPGLHQVAGSYHDERREIVHMSDGHRGYDAREKEERHGKVSKADPHQSLMLNWGRRAA